MNYATKYLGYFLCFCAISIMAALGYYGFFVILPRTMYAPWARVLISIFGDNNCDIESEIIITLISSFMSYRSICTF